MGGIRSKIGGGTSKCNVGEQCMGVVKGKGEIAEAIRVKSMGRGG